MKRPMLLLAGFAALAAGLASLGTAGIAGSGISSEGVVTQVASVYVNGVHFDTSLAEVTIDGYPATESDIQVGHVIKVFGTVDPDGVNGRADRIVVEHALTGPVVSVEASGASLIVMGQRVRLDATTLIDPAIGSAEAIGPGDILRVSGFPDAQGDIAATRIDRLWETQMKLAGVVSGRDDERSVLWINGQTVDFSGAALDEMPAVGMRLRARGLALGAVGELLATEVRSADDGFPTSSAALQGLVTHLGADGEYVVAGRSVVLDDDAQFVNGTAGDLALNARVRLVGALDDEGRFVAERVRFARIAEVDLAGTIEWVDSAAGTVGVDGWSVQIDNLTTLTDHSQLRARPFGVTNLAAGDYVQLRARATARSWWEWLMAPTSLVATSLIRMDGGNGDDDDSDSDD